MMNILKIPRIMRMAFLFGSAFFGAKGAQQAIYADELVKRYRGKSAECIPEDIAIEISSYISSYDGHILTYFFLMLLCLILSKEQKK